MTAPKVSPPEVPDVSLPLVITLFGPMQVLVMGQPIPRLRSRKALWLLALLALRHGRPVEREWLAGTLWPDAYQDQALANLRTVLSELRGALGDAGKYVQSPNRHSLCLDRMGAEVDVTAFDAAISAKSHAALEQAASLYRGALLEGCTEEWVGQERGRREQGCLQALLSLADAELAAGNHGIAASHYRQALALDPWRDAAWRGLMEALARGGDVNAALQSYRDFVALLRDDPKAAPGEETHALYARLRTQARQQATFAAEGPVVDKAPSPTVRGYLPHSLTDLVGREDESSEVTARLRRSRLVTLTGPGGIGKTRLALAVAVEAVPEYADGVWLVTLETLTAGEQVPAQIAAVLGVKEEPDQSLLESMTDFLKTKRLLLVLDNCEHLLTACAQMAERLLRECAGVRVLATSREVLGVTGEAAWAVPGLSAPDPAHLPAGRTTLIRVLAGYESIQLFLERAQAVQKTFSLTGENGRAVAEICARLGGMPLAIELAAARVKALTVGQIASRLDDHLSLLTGGSRVAPSRQQTLRATMDWSYGLLGEGERRLLACLSVFSGGWDLEAAEAVCAGEGIKAGHVLDLLASLADKSLVVFEEQPTGGRYRLLEMVRQYAAERLTVEGAECTASRHRDHFLVLAEEGREQLKGPGQGQWLCRLETERDNLRSALVWCERDAQGAEAGLRLSGAMCRFWYIRGDFSEGREHLVRMLSMPGGHEATAARAKALNGAGVLASRQDDHPAARELFMESLRLYRDLDDKQGVAEALNNVGILAYSQWDWDTARAFFEESLGIRRTIDDKEGYATTLANIGLAAEMQGDHAASQVMYEESLRLFRDLGDTSKILWLLGNLAGTALQKGDRQTSQALSEESLLLAREIGDRLGAAMALQKLGDLALLQSALPSAEAAYQESLGLFEDIGDRIKAAWILLRLGSLACERKELAAARRAFEQSWRLLVDLGDRQGEASALRCLGDLAQDAGDITLAGSLYRQSVEMSSEAGDRAIMLNGLRGMAGVLLAQGEGTRAVRLWGATHALSRDDPFFPSEQERYDRLIKQAHETLGEPVFVAAWEEGRPLTWEQAAAYALENTTILNP